GCSSEIVPAFKGLSEKVLPGTKPALDLPVTFTRAPTSVMLGFLASAFVFLVLMLIFAATGWFVLVPPMIMLFFGGGAGGVFGNAVAGWRGALFGGVLNGIVLAFGQAIGWSLYAGTATELATLADADWYAVAWALIGIGSLLAPLGTGAVWGVAVVALVVTIAILVVLGRRAPSEGPAESLVAGERETERVGAAAASPSGGALTAAEPAPRARSCTDRPATLDVLAVCGA